jgi:phosphopentomutase
MTRALIVVLDSFGIGSAPDAESFGDQGADTLGHIAAHCAQGHNDPRRNDGPLRLPNLTALGLTRAARLCTGKLPAGMDEGSELHGHYGACAELSYGKDTPSGHWEMAGLPVQFDWGYFPPQAPSFPQALTDAFIQRANLPGVLGNCHASGTTIIAELGAEHIASGKPIVYTSADSVFQIAAHEEHFGLERLLEICQIARELVDEYNIGRVIARPFIGEEGNYQRTGNRRDYATPPHQDTLLDQLQQSGREVIAVGKIKDIFAARGITQHHKANGTQALFDATLKALDQAPDGSLIFANFVNFDSDYGHRRDILGYAAELELFDRLLPQLQQAMAPDDLLILSADHGCDPSWPGSDHTREYVPFLAYGKSIGSGELGLRGSMADIGQTIARYLGIDELAFGEGVVFGAKS